MEPAHHLDKQSNQFPSCFRWNPKGIKFWQISKIVQECSQDFPIFRPGDLVSNKQKKTRNHQGKTIRQSFIMTGCKMWPLEVNLDKENVDFEIKVLPMSTSCLNELIKQGSMWNSSIFFTEPSIKEYWHNIEMIEKQSYFAWSVRAHIPAARGALADVPVCVSVQLPLISVVTWK